MLCIDNTFNKPCIQIAHIPRNCINFTIALDKALFSIQYWYFSYFSTKTYVVGTHLKCLTEALLMSTHNLCFCGEIRKILIWYSLLSRHMLYWYEKWAFMLLTITQKRRFFFSTKQCWCFFLFLNENMRVLIYALLMSTHNMFLWRYKKNIYSTPSYLELCTISKGSYQTVDQRVFCLSTYEPQQVKMYLWGMCQMDRFRFIPCMHSLIQIFALYWYIL